MNYIYVMIGGALGALMRYGVGRWCEGVVAMGMPVGTFVVNVVGCLLLGVLTACGELCPQIPRGIMLLLSVGMCGAFTTFSTFSAESVRMADEGHLLAMLSYVVASIVMGFLLFYGGRAASTFLLTKL